jgi:Protein of Unknown function (DUF2784)
VRPVDCFIIPMDLILANTLMFFHFTYLFFVIGGFVYVWLGFFFHWKSIHNRLFRWTHLAAMGIVVLETIGGVFCPLTVWEDELRRRAGQSFLYPRGFIPYWVHRSLYYDWPGWVFLLIYSIFFIAMGLTFIFIPPQKADR